MNEEDEKAAQRCSGQSPRHSEKLHPGAGTFVAHRDSRAAGETHSNSAHGHALARSLMQLTIHCAGGENPVTKKKN